MRNAEQPPGDPPQNNENFIQGDQPRSEDTQRQRTTGGPTRDLRHGTDQRDQDINVRQTPIEAPPVMVRSPRAGGNYTGGDRIPGSFVIGTVPIEDSPLTSRNTSRVMSFGNDTPMEEDTSSTIGQAAREAVRALEMHNTPEAPASREQALQYMQEYLRDVENQWWEYEDNILFDNHGVRPNEHHARQFRHLHQLLEEFGGGSESPGDEDQESMIVKRETPGSRATSPVMSNRGARSLAQEIENARRARALTNNHGGDSGTPPIRNQGRAPNPNERRRPAYLSGREEDVMRHLYGDQVSEVMRRTISQRA